MNLETFGAALAGATAALKEAGLAEVRLEARRLVAFAAGVKPTELIAREADRFDAQARLDTAVAQRCARTPLAHILGETGFFGLDLICDVRALIPRADSEAVVEAALACVPEVSDGLVADLGTGSGCLLLAVLANRAGMCGIGVEASGPAAALARENVVHTGLEMRAEIVEATWADWQGWGQADLVVSNPPYIASAEIETLQPEVRDHDPRAALDGGADGLDCYRELARLGADRMKPGAWLVLEIGHDQSERVPQILAEAGFQSIMGTRDLGGHVRAVAALKQA